MSITVRFWTKDDLLATRSDPHLATVLGNVTTFSPAELRAFYLLTFRNYEVYFDGDPEPHKIRAIDDSSLFWFLEQEYYTAEILDIYDVTNEEQERKLSLDSLAKNPRFTMDGYATIYH